MAELLYLLAKSARIRQWLKNLVIFTAIVFTGQFTNLATLIPTIIAFGIFCLLSSSIYFLNDIIDIPSDSLHPFKKNRPIASGKLDKSLAFYVAIAMMVSALSLAYLLLPKAFFFVAIIFVGLQISYVLFLKHIALIDVIAIALAFIIRVFAGEAATGFHINIWLFFTIISLALFLALGKRRGELTLLTGGDVNISPKTRLTLSRYSEKMLDVYLSMFSTATWLTYTFYAFLARPSSIRQSVSTFLEDNFLVGGTDRKWLMMTVPLVIYGIMRYLQLIYEKREGESPEKMLLKDKPLMFTVIIWGAMVFGIIYILGR